MHTVIYDAGTRFWPTLHISICTYQPPGLFTPCFCSAICSMEGLSNTGCHRVGCSRWCATIWQQEVGFTQQPIRLEPPWGSISSSAACNVFGCQTLGIFLQKHARFGLQFPPSNNCVCSVYLYGVCSMYIYRIPYLSVLIPHPKFQKY